MNKLYQQTVKKSKTKTKKIWQGIIRLSIGHLTWCMCPLLWPQDTILLVILIEKQYNSFKQDSARVNLPGL